MLPGMISALVVQPLTAVPVGNGVMVAMQMDNENHYRESNGTVSNMASSDKVSYVSARLTDH
jgi:hypothetical protein